MNVDFRQVFLREMQQTTSTIIPNSEQAMPTLKILKNTHFLNITLLILNTFLLMYVLKVYKQLKCCLFESYLHCEEKHFKEMNKSYT